jgi:hypothetical protein
MRFNTRQMIHTDSEDAWYSRLTSERSLRAFERTTHLTTAAAFVLTILAVATAEAAEANFVTASMLSGVGWTLTGLSALVVASVTFWYLDRHRETAPRSVAVGAVLLAGLGIADLVVNVWVVSQTGLPETMMLSVWAPAPVVGLTGLTLAFRREVGAGLRLVRGLTPAWSPSPQALAAVAFALVLVVSGVGPFAGLGGIAPTNYDGVASAQTSADELALVG